jgi:Trk K+ transport system NAD-binding subunit
VDEVNIQTLEDLDIRLCEAAVCLLTDDENLRIVELLYEKFGTRDVIVRLNHRYNFDKFHDLGALIVEPTTAIVSLLDHLVRSPQAASLLLGMEGDQDSIDIEVQNRNLHGLLLRDLRLPSDTIVLSVNRGGHTIISHGYTRLRIGDYITLVGSKEGLEAVSRKFALQ